MNAFRVTANVFREGRGNDRNFAGRMTFTTTDLALSNNVADTFSVPDGYEAHIDQDVLVCIAGKKLWLNASAFELEDAAQRLMELACVLRMPKLPKAAE